MPWRRAGRASRATVISSRPTRILRSYSTEKAKDWPADFGALNGDCLERMQTLDFLCVHRISVVCLAVPTASRPLSCGLAGGAEVQSGRLSVSCNSLVPGFSRVLGGEQSGSRFNGFGGWTAASAAGKTVKP